MLERGFVKAVVVASGAEFEAHESSAAMARGLLLLGCFSYLLDDYSPNKAMLDIMILFSKFPHSIIAALLFH